MLYWYRNKVIRESMRTLKYFGAPKKFIDILYEHSSNDRVDSAYIEESINFLKLDLSPRGSEKVKGIKTRHPVFRIKCKKNRSYRIFYAWDRINIVILEIDPRDERTYSRDMLDKLRNRVRLAEMEGFLK